MISLILSAAATEKPESNLVKIDEIIRNYNPKPVYSSS